MSVPFESAQQELASHQNLPFGRIYSRLSKNGSSKLSQEDNEDIRHSMKSLEKVKTKPAPFKKISPRGSPK